MDETTKRQQIKVYFAKFPKWTIWIIGLALLMMLATEGVVRYVICPLAIVLPVLVILKASKRPADEQVDAWLAEDVSNLKKKALEKSGLDPSEQIREAVVILGTRFRKTGGAQRASAGYLSMCVRPTYRKAAL
jgi:hypothetical protein